MKRMPRCLFVLCLGLLGACAALGGRHASYTVYAPRLAPPVAASTDRVDWQLLVETPRASAALGTPRIAVAPTPGVLEVYADARWRDPAPQMLRSLIVQAFDDSGRIGGVSGSTSGLSADYSLVLELRDFQAELDGPAANAAIRFTAKLFDHRRSRVVATQAFAATRGAASADIGNMVGAFEQALNELLPQLVDWTLREGNAHRQAAQAEREAKADPGSPQASADRG